MSRRPRIPSITGIYHVMLRGINRETIFFDDIDFLKMEKILRSLSKPVDGSGNPKPPICKIFAYCLMTNHLHLLIAEQSENISSIAKRLGVPYAMYFNKRRKRHGPVFEDRFRSEPVNDSDYFITLLHYIHYNPVKAGMVLKPEWYKWSSWHEYELPDDTYEKGICVQDIPFDNLSRKQVQDIVLNGVAPENIMASVDKKRLDDEEAESILKSLATKAHGTTNLKELPKVERLALTVKAQEFGITYRKLIKYLGVNQSAIYRKRLQLKNI